MDSECLLKELDCFQKKIINKTLKLLYKNYIFIDRNTNKNINLEDINLVFNTKRCLGITNSKQCNFKSILDYDYCKKHVKNVQQKITHDTIDIPIVLLKSKINDSNDINKKPKVFISEMDSFYYIDENFIYDTITFEKVGIIKNKEYVFTENPYILELI